MQFHNSTPHIVAIAAIDRYRGAIVGSLGMIAPMKMTDIPIVLHATDGSGAQQTHDGSIILRSRRGRHDPANDQFAIGLKRMGERPLYGADPLALRFSCIARPRRGKPLRFELRQDVDLERWRAQAAEVFGRRLHIKAKIGPVVQRPNGIGCPIETVDDRFLSGSFNTFPQKSGHVLIVGYWK